jgi:uncharacterized protein
MKRFPFGFLIVFLFIVWMLLQFLISLYPHFLWFDNLGFSSVFWTNLNAKVITGIVFSLLFFIIAGVNVFVSRSLAKGEKRVAPQVNLKKIISELFGESVSEDDSGYINVTPDPGSKKRMNLIWGAGIFVVSLFVGLSAVTQWQVILKAFNAVAFQLADPVFGRDIGFYVFQLPFQKFLQGFIFTAFIVSLAAVLWNYLISGSITFEQLKLSFAKGVKAHLAILLAIITILLAWGLWLGSLEILYSARGVVFGAGYADVKAQLLGYNLQIFVLLAVAALFIINIFQKNYLVPIGGIVFYFVVAVAMGGIYPALVQNLYVKPNEISLEMPYITNAIKYTRIGYGLDKIEEKPFEVKDNLTKWDLRRNSLTIDNIRLWDTRPLIKTYRQLQGIRLYYDFSDVDVDRYNIDGKYRQVMLSPREMHVTKLPEKAQTWVNQHLKFTHGYGACLSPVNEQTPEGLPNLIVKNIPPETKTNLKITRPEIYYGEDTNNYVIVKTTEKEFDYPKGDKNVYTTYKGKGGVVISSFLRRLAFAITFSDLKILLTEYITNDSRIMFDRSISRRVQKIAPFLRYDRDPYIVISKGRLFWIQDAYTVSDRFPYSDPSGSIFNQFNYIRNSVKVVIDAYNGDMVYYIIDDKDPVVKTYQKIYPKLFKSFAKMPKELKKHIRYPYDLFLTQVKKYASFHMKDPQVFYNQEDLWNIPKEIVSRGEQPMDAYYTIMKLPEERREEFLLMLPFTPNRKDNMIAWMAARSDMPNYGKLIVYKFPKDKLVYGPMQIEARIDQQTEISQQFTLWGQGGSRVIRGDLLAIPIEQSILYIEPIYLEASSGELPELKRVIAAYGKNVVMSETLDGALANVFSGRMRRSPNMRVGNSKKDIAKRALELYNDAQLKLKEMRNLIKDLGK